MLLLNYKYLSPACREMRCSVSWPRFQEFGFLSEETPQEISQTKPAKGEAAYLTTSRQNRFFFCSPCPPFFFHLLPSGGASLWYSLPRGPFFFPESSRLHPILSCSCSVFNSHLGCKLFCSLHLCIFWSIAVSDLPLQRRLKCWPCQGQSLSLLLKMGHGVVMVAKQGTKGAHSSKPRLLPSRQEIFPFFLGGGRGWG